jgi:hypothetical protein
MSTTTPSGRRVFLTEAAAAVLGVTSVVVSSCSTPAPTAPAAPEDREGAIDLNHGHVARVTAERLAAVLGFTLEIQGASIHGHALELTADDVARIRGGERVTVLSAAGWEDKHDHRVTFNA